MDKDYPTHVNRRPKDPTGRQQRRFPPLSSQKKGARQSGPNNPPWIGSAAPQPFESDESTGNLPASIPYHSDSQDSELPQPLWMRQEASFPWVHSEESEIFPSSFSSRNGPTPLPLPTYPNPSEQRYRGSRPLLVILVSAIILSVLGVLIIKGSRSFETITIKQPTATPINTTTSAVPTIQMPGAGPLVKPTPTVTPQPTVTASATPQQTATPVPLVLTIDDAIRGTSLDQFNYIGVGWIHDSYSQTSNSAYGNSLSYDSKGTDSVVIHFAGTRIQIYGTMDINLGIANYNLDGGPATVVDQYRAAQQNQILLFDSGVLAEGKHMLSISVTGTHNPSSSDSYITIDFAKVTSTKPPHQRPKIDPAEIFTS
jgi:hypothetical protein